MNYNYPPLSPTRSGQLMSFPNAMQAVIDGKRITKLEWKDAEYYAQLRNERLMLHKPGGWFDWIVSEADMMGEDWLVYEPALNA